MEYLHDRDIVHFDLKCENFLCDLRDLLRPVVKVSCTNCIFGLNLKNLGLRYAILVLNLPF